MFSRVNQNPEPYYGTIYLISITLIIFSVVVGFLISAKIIDPTITEPNIGFYNNPFSLIVSFIVTVLLIASILSVFSFLIPKAIGFKYSDSLGRFFIKILVPLSKFFVLPAKFLNAISNFILIPFREKTSFSQSNPSEDEILHIISDGVKSGAIDEMEEEIIKNVIEFNDVRANEVMVPRTEMIAVDIGEQDEDLLKSIILRGHTLVPVFEESLDHIIGIIHSKDVIKILLESNSIASLKKLIRPAYFIPENKLISEILTEMQKRGERLAIVTDEYGGTEGVITIEKLGRKWFNLKFIQITKILMKDKRKTEIRNFDILKNIFSDP
ncbi:MAG: CNNM domain-containing protein [Ignavibacteriaceae bacterium]